MKVQISWICDCMKKIIFLSRPVARAEQVNISQSPIPQKEGSQYLHPRTNTRISIRNRVPRDENDVKMFPTVLGLFTWRNWQGNETGRFKRVRLFERLFGTRLEQATASDGNSFRLKKTNFVKGRTDKQTADSRPCYWQIIMSVIPTALFGWSLGFCS